MTQCDCHPQRGSSLTHPAFSLSTPSTSSCTPAGPCWKYFYYYYYYYYYYYHHHHHHHYYYRYYMLQVQIGHKNRFIWPNNFVLHCSEIKWKSLKCFIESKRTRTDKLRQRMDFRRAYTTTINGRKFACKCLSIGIYFGHSCRMKVSLRWIPLWLSECLRWIPFRSYRLTRKPQSMWAGFGNWKPLVKWQPYSRSPELGIQPCSTGRKAPLSQWRGWTVSK